MMNALRSASNCTEGAATGEHKKTRHWLSSYRSISYRQDLAHDVLRLTADLLAEVVERLQIRLVQRVSDDLDVHLIEVLLVDTTLEKWG